MRFARNRQLGRTHFHLWPLRASCPHWREGSSRGVCTQAHKTFSLKQDFHAAVPETVFSAGMIMIMTAISAYNFDYDIKIVFVIVIATLIVLLTSKSASRRTALAVTSSTIAVVQGTK